MAFDCAITRSFEVPVQRVFAAWTKPAAFGAWVWAGIGTDPRAEIELREGGTYRAATTVNGETWAFRGTYERIEPPHALIATLIWEADVGYTPGEERIEVELTPTADGCTMRFVHGAIPDARSVEGHRDGWNKAFDRLARLLGA